MTFRKIGLEALQNTGERQPLRCKTPCKRSSAHPKFASDFAYPRVSVWQEESNRILDARSKGISLSRPSRQCLVAIFDQKFIEIGIGTHNGQPFDRIRKCHFIGSCPERNVASEECREL